MAKNGIKELIKTTIISKYDFHLENNTIIAIISKKTKSDSFIILAKRRYPFKDGVSHIPNTKRNRDLLLNYEFVIETQFLGRRLRFKPPKSAVSFSVKTLGVGGYSFKESLDSYYEIEKVCSNNDDLIISFSFFSFDNIEKCKIYLVKDNYDILGTFDEQNNCIIIHDYKELLLENETIKIIPLLNDSYCAACGQNYSIDGADFKIINGIMTIIRNNNDHYSFPASHNEIKIPPLTKNSKYVENVTVDRINTGLVIKMKDSFLEMNDPSFIITTTSMKTRDVNVIQEFGRKQSEYRLDDFDSLFSAENIDYIERKFISYRVCDSSGKELESGFLKDTTPKRYSADGSIMTEFGDLQISYYDNNYLILQNKDNHFLFNNKFDIDQRNATFTTDFLINSQDNGKVDLDITVISLLQNIRELTIYARDTYKNLSYHLITKKYEGSKLIRDRIQLDLNAINGAMYYNMRLNFHIGIIYENGYKESSFLAMKRGDYSVKDRYLSLEEQDEMVTVLYIGENRYNLNLWYTSSEEYVRGVETQCGKERFNYVLENDPMDNHLIVFEANLGKNYTGNPKYLYEYMISHPEKYGDFMYVWALPDEHERLIPGNPLIAERGSEKYFEYLGKAKYWVNNILFPVKEKRYDGVYLNTWHGTPLKKLGFDIEIDGPEKQAFGNLYAESLNWDYLLVDNDYGEEKLTGAFHFKKDVIKKGYPINDIFFDDKRIKTVSERLSIKYPMIRNKKLVLYAPTWRDLQGDYVRGYEFNLPFNIEKLYKAIGDDYVIAVKLHHLISDNLSIEDKYSDFVINMSKEEDIMEILCITDILITDYSSVFYDFASARKPILFYMYDLEEYLNDTRGLYVDIDKLPGPILKTTEEMIDQIVSINNGCYNYTEQLLSFCDEMSHYCKGTSCRDVLDIIIDEEDIR